MGRSPAAYQIRRERLPRNHLAILEGRMPLDQVLACARARGVTLTELMTAIFLRAIHAGMRVRDRKKPVVITGAQKPIDLEITDANRAEIEAAVAGLTPRTVQVQGSEAQLYESEGDSHLVWPVEDGLYWVYGPADGETLLRIAESIGQEP